MVALEGTIISEVEGLIKEGVGEVRQQFAAKLDDAGNNDAAQMVEQVRSLKSGQCEKG